MRKFTSLTVRVASIEFRDKTTTKVILPYRVVDRVELFTAPLNEEGIKVGRDSTTFFLDKGDVYSIDRLLSAGEENTVSQGLSS